MAAYKKSPLMEHFTKRTMRGMTGPTEAHLLRLCARYKRLYKVDAQ